MANYSVVDSPMDSPDTVDLLSGGGEDKDLLGLGLAAISSQSQQQPQQQLPLSPPQSQLQPSRIMIPATTSNSSQPSSSTSTSVFYQMDFDVEHVGKKKPQSKRVATWRYGMVVTSSNGITSMEQHEAKLVWSTHSGKYAISVDGEEVSAAVAKGSVLEHKWKWSHSRGIVVEEDDAKDEKDAQYDIVKMRILACRKPPVRSSKNFRCYEFVIEGKVFRDLPFHDGSGDGLSCQVGSDVSTREGEFYNEDRMEEDNYNYTAEQGGCSAHFHSSSYDDDDGKLTSILDVIEPGWRSAGFA